MKVDKLNRMGQADRLALFSWYWNHCLAVFEQLSRQGLWGIITGIGSRYRRPCTPREFHFADFTLDQAGYRLERAERRVRLEKLPMELLILLVERHGELVSREEIAQRLWGNDVFVDVDHSINIAVRKIRVALRDDPEKPRFVETVIGKGYRFTAPVTVDGNSEAQLHTEAAGASTGSVPGGGSIESRNSSARWVVLVTSLVVPIVFALVYVLSRDGRGTKSALPIRSLAVLPLQNLSGDPSQDYVADGMTEALITDLAKIRALRVISRTSVMQYKTNNKPLAKIRQELNVDAVVEGSVQRSGDRVRVTAQLVQTNPERHLWAESYQRDLRDVLALQSELAGRIAGEIRVKLTPQEKERLDNVNPVNPASYEAYLKGLYCFNDGRDHIGTKGGDESFQKSLGYLREAVRIDPTHAIAYAQLARTCHWIASVHFDGELVAESKKAASRALELNSNLAEAYGVLAYVKYAFEGDWAGAEQEFKRTFELNPGYGEAHHGYALYLITMGRMDEAVAEIEKALLLDPLTLPQKINAAYIYACAGQYDSGLEQLRNILALNPKFYDAYFDMGRIYLRQGKFEQGIEQIQEGTRLRGSDIYTDTELAMAYAASGRREEASRILHRLTIKAILPVNIAATYALLGDKSSAIAWLGKAAQGDPVDFAGARCLAGLDDVRRDPQVQAMFSRLGLTP